MKYVYRNKITGGVVQLTKPRARYDASPDWELIEGQAPAPAAGPVGGEQTVIDPAALDDATLVDLFLASAAALLAREETVDVSAFEARREEIEKVFGGRLDFDGDGEVELTIEELLETVTGLDDDDLIAVGGAVEAQVGERGLQVADESTPAADGDAEPKPENPADPGDEVAGQTEIEATAAAVELAEAQGIDLRTVTGTGDDGRIVIEDVRKAVAEKAAS